ncbi:hypothetical protein ACFYXD_24600 [Streptomyces platensis]|uniref:hypothetical protein n=1 Tax=Streptomyces platensis TaxID=58346 RepID=UPI0036ACFCA9
MSYVEHQHIKEWLTQHEHQILDAEYSKSLESYLDTLPWDPSRIRWSDIPHQSVQIPDSPGVNFLHECLNTTMGAHEFTMITYNGSDRSILCRTEEALLDIDLLYGRAPGPRYFCGVDRVDEQIILHSQDFGEYDIPKLTFRIAERS